MKKIGIMGGTFNPVHNAHLILAECAYEQFKLDSVWFMPSKNPPHKRNQYIETKEHRSNMIKLALNGNPKFEFSDFELSRPGLTFTADTLSILRRQYTDVEFYFILGEDSLFNFENWKRPDIIVELAQVIVAKRGIYEDHIIKDKIEYLKDKYQSDSIALLESPISNLSAQVIRDNIKLNKSIKYYVSADVEQYIYDNNLYLNDDDCYFNEID